MTAENRKMTPEEFRRAMHDYWKQVDEEAEDFKDPYVRLDRLRSLFNKLDADERLLANGVLGEWALSGDEKRRFDALVLIRELNITTALPILEELMRRFSKIPTPRARNDLQHARQLAAELMDHQRRNEAS
jgi:hypothetical protein